MGESVCVCLLGTQKYFAENKWGAPAAIKR